MGDVPAHYNLNIEMQENKPGMGCPSSDKVRASFVDLKAFARESSVGYPPSSVTVPVPADVYFTGRRYLRQDPGAVLLGAATLGRGEGCVPGQPFDEFVIVCDGCIELIQGDGTITVLESGQSAVLKKGTPFTWRVADQTTFVFMGYRKGDAGEPGVVRVATDAAKNPSKPPSADLLMGPTPDCKSQMAHQSQDEVFACGTWQATPYRRRSMDYKYYELMYLLEGSVTFEDPDGRRGTFSQGDIFVIEQHAQCAWDSVVNVSKVFVVASDD
jgi:uncharacterized cupin superfamily protein